VTGARAIGIPDPALVLLIGPAGSGKSTFAARHFDPDEVVSSDALRATIAGDARDQSRNRAVFAALERAVERRLTAGRLTVVDATNLEAHARRSLLAVADRTGRSAIAIVLDLPLPTVHGRNVGRERVVDGEVVERHHARLTRLLARRTLEAEGFAAIHLLTGTAAVDGTRVTRSPAVAGSA
jgi:protein phosphatase